MPDLRHQVVILDDTGRTLRALELHGPAAADRYSTDDWDLAREICGEWNSAPAEAKESDEVAAEVVSHIAYPVKPDPVRAAVITDPPYREGALLRELGGASPPSSETAGERAAVGEGEGSRDLPMRVLRRSSGRAYAFRQELPRLLGPGSPAEHHLRMTINDELRRRFALRVADAQVVQNSLLRLLVVNPEVFANARFDPVKFRPRPSLRTGGAWVFWDYERAGWTGVWSNGEIAAEVFRRVGDIENFLEEHA